MALETKLYQKLTQQLVMTPQLRQAIKILQVSRQELEEIVAQELEENPTLEEDLEETSPAIERQKLTDEGGPGVVADGQWTEALPPRETMEELAPSDRLSDIDWKEYLQNYSNDWQAAAAEEPVEIDEEEEERRPLENRPVKQMSLTEHLIWQLRMNGIPPAEEHIAAVLLGHLNEDGYLTVALEDVAFQLREDFDSVERVLRRIQELDPPGVGARDLRECLLIQLRANGQENSLAYRIVRECLHLLEGRRYDRIAKELGVTAEEVSEAARRIAALDPKPARDFDVGEVRYVTPDVFVHKIGDEFVVTLNDDGLPRLRVSNYYRQVLTASGNGDAKRYVQDKLRSAAWLIKSIQQRQRTVYLVTQSIVKFQREFFEHGISHLKPLVLKDVAMDVGMHESTVSRATANKYVHTPQGTFELKFFFTSSLQTEDGEEVSAESVKERIREIIAGEDPRNPLSDQQIAKILAAENVHIARRTVAKYREMMGIFSSSKRRRTA
ncbi:MAG: RNA polymerase sigma-54 factor [Candidatus Binatia bacterium]|nr:MAG: RNA polymerase sigma-54 factor [Candidatus Binatia bacterium]